MDVVQRNDGDMVAREVPWWAKAEGVVQVVTMLRGLSAREACQRWGSTRARVVTRDYEELLAEIYEEIIQQSRSGPWIAAWEIDGVTVVWEPASIQGVRREVLAGVTDGGVTACAVNVEVHVWPTLVYAVDGQVRTYLADVPGWPLEKRLTGTDVPEVVAAARQAGVRLDASLFDPGQGRANVAVLQETLMGGPAVRSGLDDTVLAARIEPRP